MRLAKKATNGSNNRPNTYQSTAVLPRPSPDDARRQAVVAVQSIYSAPIAFYGRVTDQYGAPVPRAIIDYSIVDQFFEPGSRKAGVANNDGLFSLTGIKGAALTVGVSKEGYAPIYGQSNASFSYGMPFDPERDHPIPTSDQPAMFILRKKVPADPLFVVHRDVPVPKDGTAIEISLRTGKPTIRGQGDVKVECWTADEKKDAQGRYEWHARVSIPGGGLIRRTDNERDFEAPETGYKPSLELSMPREAIRWERNHDGHYWVILRDRSFARMRLRLTTIGAHFVSISAFLNPSGSRNLEFDENKVIK